MDASVRASHNFLAKSDINEICECLPEMFANIIHLVVAIDENDTPVAFMGVEYGTDNLGIERITVNEQNPNVIGFYEHLSFRRYLHTENDEEGRPFPLIFMRYDR